MTLSAHQVDTVRALREANASMKEAADAAGCSVATARSYCKAMGLDGIRKEQERPGAREGTPAHEALRAYGLSRFLENMERNGHTQHVEYVSGYTAYDQPVMLRCLEHGTLIERNAQFARKARRLQLPCCIEGKGRAQVERAQEARAAREARALERKAERQATRAAREQARHRVCAVCGESFIGHPQQVTCSTECRRRYQNRYRELYKRAKRQRMPVYDPAITLERLVDRDHGICHICGEAVDYSDHVLSLEGHFIVGPDYPSIDHIVPVVRGGAHMWENVALAHHLCNSIKSDT